jgi:preprotein translocase subunit SecA
MLVDRIVKAFVGSKFDRDMREIAPVVRRINILEPQMVKLAAEDFPRKTDELRTRIRAGESLDALLPEAYALVREAARRVLDQRIFDTQIVGAILIHRGSIVEMKTGEGKTLAFVPAAYLNSLSGAGVHIVTVNDYLAGRDAEWMGTVYRCLGVSVGAILSQMDNPARQRAYAQDITYGTNNEFGFDYLRDNMCWDASQKVQRSHNFAIVDEIDSILIDEARTPLIISGGAEDDTGRYHAVNRLVGQLTECAKDPQTGEYPELPQGDYTQDEKSKKISFTDEGMNHIEQVLQQGRVITGSLFEDANFEYIHYFTQSLRAHHLFRNEVDYVVQDGLVQIVDEFTGRILQGRRYSDGLHQAIEAKEGIRIAQRNRTLATITFQNYFRLYTKLAGGTGTAETEATEFAKIYNLDVAVVPTNRPVVRKDQDDLIFLKQEYKLAAIVEEIARLQQKGQPVLVGTVSIEKSETLSRLLTARGVRHEVLNAKNHAREALIIAQAGAKSAVTIATNMAGRGTDIRLGGNPEYLARKRAGTQATPEQLAKALAAELPEWERAYEEVKSVGGLFVLGTERHESRRIDNQLRGRSGRQGDPGESRFYISLDDELMRLFGANLQNMMSRIGMQGGEPLYHPWISKSIERAQKRVEERNFEVRKHLLEYDDVVSEQRKFIYQKRDDIIADQSLTERTLEAGIDVVDDAVEEHRQAGGISPVALASLLARLKASVFFSIPLEISHLQGRQGDALKSALSELLAADLEAKAKELGAENLNLFIRAEYLRSIDQRWQDHLENLEALRDAVYLRHYAQKNPLLEYKLEGFQIFDEMLQEVRIAIAEKVFKVRIRPVEERAGASLPSATAVHNPAAQFGGRSTARRPQPLGHPPAPSGTNRGAAPQGSAPERAQVTRSVPKVGRNDPCPCGSGKKYKLCHGQ